MLQCTQLPIIANKILLESTYTTIISNGEIERRV
jgi:hypothetical protein